MNQIFFNSLALCWKDGQSCQSLLCLCGSEIGVCHFQPQKASFNRCSSNKNSHNYSQENENVWVRFTWLLLNDEFKHVLMSEIRERITELNSCNLSNGSQQLILQSSPTDNSFQILAIFQEFFWHFLRFDASKTKPHVENKFGKWFKLGFWILIHFIFHYAEYSIPKWFSGFAVGSLPF
jgi:hypothetical protein